MNGFINIITNTIEIIPENVMGKNAAVLRKPKAIMVWTIPVSKNTLATKNSSSQNTVTALQLLL